MAWLSTSPDSPRIDEPPLIRAAAIWKEKCLLSDGSIFSDSPLWTTSNFAIFDEYFINKPIIGDQSFLVKFRQQLEPTPKSVKQLAAEMLWLLFLFPSNIGGPKKRHNIMEVWSWSGDNLDGSHPLLLILDRGIGSAGQAFNQRRDLELALVARLTKGSKELDEVKRANLIEDPWAFGNWLDGVPDASSRGFRHMLLFLFFPDFYERIATARHKNTIATTFSSIAKDSFIQNGDSTNIRLDKNLLAIRKELEKEYPNQEIDFYRRPIREKWMRSESEEEDDDNDSADDNQKASGLESGPRLWIEKTLVKGRPDREQGEHRLGSALWSPQKAKNGGDFYKNMREVREGDIVLHLIDNKHFSGVSLAAGGADDTFQGLANTAWQGPAYRIPLHEYKSLDPPLEREEFLESPLGAAELVHLSLLPDKSGDGPSWFRDVLSDEEYMARVFEEFIRNFYDLKQSKFAVRRTQPKWSATATQASHLKYLPTMKTDVTLSTLRRTIIIDAKYYRDALQTYQGSRTIHSGNLYQLLAYLRGSVEELLPEGSMEGMLIYPVGEQSVDLSYEIDGFPIRIFTLDLGQPWTRIEADLLGLVA